MSNIFKCQENIKNYFPQVSKVRIYPSLDLNYSMTVYYEKRDGSFDASFGTKLKSVLPAHISFNFKPYSELGKDNVPPAPKLPELIENLALQQSSGNQKEFRKVLDKAFAGLNPTIDIPPTKYGERVTINIKLSKKLSDSELEKYTIYAQELAPMGCIVKIIN
jgi:hypothetical protein